MTGKQILLDAFKCNPTPRPPWLPFVGVHGGKLINVNAKDYLQSADNIVKGITRANQLYQPDALPITFDLQLEAESLGCRLKWDDQTPPAVISNPLAGKSSDATDQLPQFDLASARWPIVTEATRTIAAQLGDQIALYGLITGPFTLAMHLRGNEIFLDMFDTPHHVEHLVQYCANIAKQVASAYIDNGTDVIAVVDPMTSQISPEHFQQFVTPYLNPLFQHIRDAGALSSLFVCGDATRNLEVMCATACDNISVDENICLETLGNLAHQNNKSFGGNLKLTTVLLLGTEDDARLDAIRCIDIGDNLSFILAPGCDLPFDTPPKNLQAVAEMVHNEYQRQVARTTITAQSAAHFDEIQPPDYPSLPHITIDIVTLDSSACAPCQYMTNAVRQAVKKLNIPVKVTEHKITTREGVAFMLKIGATAIPSICIEGQIAFASIIPDINTLTAAILDKANNKNIT